MQQPSRTANKLTSIRKQQRAKELEQLKHALRFHNQFKLLKDA
jgi:hypothetical protein